LEDGLKHDEHDGNDDKHDENRDEHDGIRDGHGEGLSLEPLRYVMRIATPLTPTAERAMTRRLRARWQCIEHSVQDF
jgi:hypothetical protein